MHRHNHFCAPGAALFVLPILRTGLLTAATSPDQRPSAAVPAEDSPWSGYGDGTRGGEAIFALDRAPENCLCLHNELWAGRRCIVGRLYEDACIVIAQWQLSAVQQVEAALDPRLGIFSRLPVIRLGAESDASSSDDDEDLIARFAHCPDGTVCAMAAGRDRDRRTSIVCTPRTGSTSQAAHAATGAQTVPEMVTPPHDWALATAEPAHERPHQRPLGAETAAAEQDAHDAADDDARMQQALTDWLASLETHRQN